MPRTVLPAEASIQKTVERLSDLVCSEPPSPLYPPERRLARVFSLGGGEEATPLWWRGLSLIPSGGRSGLLRLKHKGEVLHPTTVEEFNTYKVIACLKGVVVKNVKMLTFSSPVPSQTG